MEAFTFTVKAEPGTAASGTDGHRGTSEGSSPCAQSPEPRPGVGGGLAKAKTPRLSRKRKGWVSASPRRVCAFRMGWLSGVQICSLSLASQVHVKLVFAGSEQISDYFCSDSFLGARNGCPSYPLRAQGHTGAHVQDSTVISFNKQINQKPRTNQRSLPACESGLCGTWGESLQCL